LVFFRGPIDIAGYDERLSQQDDGASEKSTDKKNSEFDISEAVQRLGLEEDDSNKNHSFSGNGALLSMMLLRHLKIKDLRRSVSFVFWISPFFFLPKFFDIISYNIIEILTKTVGKK